MLSQICGQHSIYEDLLVALAELCNRVRRKLPLLKSVQQWAEI